MTNDEIIKTLAETETRSRSNTHRIDKLEENQSALGSLAASVAVMAKEQEHMRTDITETACDVKDIKKSIPGLVAKCDHEKVEADVRELQGKPAKRWEAVVEKVIIALAGGLIAFLLAKIGVA